MKDLDPKSLIIGFLTAVLVTVAMGNALADNQVGRYQMVYHHVNNELKLLDTSTGRVWYPNVNRWKFDPLTNRSMFELKP